MAANLAQARQVPLAVDRLVRLAAELVAWLLLRPGRAECRELLGRVDPLREDLARARERTPPKLRADLARQRRGAEGVVLERFKSQCWNVKDPQLRDVRSPLYRNGFFANKS